MSETLSDSLREMARSQHFCASHEGHKLPLEAYTAWRAACVLDAKDAEIVRLTVGLEKIERRVNGNAALPGATEFYTGYNAANDACRLIARAALSTARAEP